MAATRRSTDHALRGALAANLDEQSRMSLDNRDLGRDHSDHGEHVLHEPPIRRVKCAQAIYALRSYL